METFKLSDWLCHLSLVAVHTLAPTPRQSPSLPLIQLPCQRVQERMSIVGPAAVMTRLVPRARLLFLCLVVQEDADGLRALPDRPTHCPEMLDACGALCKEMTASVCFLPHLTKLTPLSNSALMVIWKDLWVQTRTGACVVSRSCGS